MSEYAVVLKENELEFVRRLACLGAASVPANELEEWALQYMSTDEWHDFYLTFIEQR